MKVTRQRHMTWFALFCYIFVQGFVPVGFMPSGKVDGAPFVLCHGDSLSAQWLKLEEEGNVLSVTHPLSANEPELKQASHDHVSLDHQAVGDHKIGHGSSINQPIHSNNNSHAEIQCHFSSFYFSFLLNVKTSNDIPIEVGRFNVVGPYIGHAHRLGLIGHNPRAPPYHVS